jgi:VWFA-related protein
MPVFRASSNLVVVTVFVRDRDGKPLAGLRKEDFVVSENGTPQAISVFEFQNLEQGVRASQASLIMEPAGRTPAPPAGGVRYRDRRLLVLFFDWSSMGAPEQLRAIESAQEFVRAKMTNSDLVSILSFGSRLKVEEEFTEDKDRLIETLRRFQPGLMSELATEGATSTENEENSAYSADDTEFNVFNTDRKLGALEDACRRLAALPEKKAMIYFSSGVGRTGMENQSQLQSTVNMAVRSNVSFYPVDVRGLMALPPGGDATTGAQQGTGLFSGQTQNRQRDKFADQQETLFTLASDTGGKALLDDNDLVAEMTRVQGDLDSYYILGYYSSDERRDGRFRKVDVKLASRLDARLDYRRGYFAEKEFRAYNATDRERQLEEALMLGDPVTDLPLAVEVDWFRLDARYFVPVAVKLPGSVIPLKRKGSAETTQFDFIAQVKDAKGAIAATVRDNITIRLRDENTGKLASASLLYDTGFMLSPGEFRLKMLVRENQTGKMGTFESSFKVPDIHAEKTALRLSSVVWSSQRQAAGEAVGAADKRASKLKRHPLVRDGQKLIPSVTRVFQSGQPIFVYAEAYDAQTRETDGKPAVSAMVTLYRDGKPVMESSPVVAATILPGRDKTVPVSVEFAPSRLAPGSYVAQLTVVDPLGKRFAASRASIVILPPRV